MTEAEKPIIQITTPSQTFKGHEHLVRGVAVFPDGRRMVTASYDKTVRLWDLEDGVELKKMEGHRFDVQRVAVSRDGQFIVSGDEGGALIAWNGDGESLTEPINVHSNYIWSLEFSLDSTVLASGSYDDTTVLWNTKTWQGDRINCGAAVRCVQYSPSGEHIAIATHSNIQIWNPGKRERVANFKGHSAFNGAWNLALAWTHDGKQLVSGGNSRDTSIRIWDTSTWKQVGESWKGHTCHVEMIAFNPTGTLLASASSDYQVRLWRFSDRQTIATFQHPSLVYCVTFSTDGKDILSGGGNNMVSKWAVPLIEDILEDQACKACFQLSLLPRNLTVCDADPHHQQDSS
jgi:WD40 repeat protein